MEDSAKISCDFFHVSWPPTISHSSFGNSWLAPKNVPLQAYHGPQSFSRDRNTKTTRVQWPHLWCTRGSLSRDLSSRPSLTMRPTSGSSFSRLASTSRTSALAVDEGSAAAVTGLVAGGVVDLLLFGENELTVSIISRNLVQCYMRARGREGTSFAVNFNACGCVYLLLGALALRAGNSGGKIGAVRWSGFIRGCCVFQGVGWILKECRCGFLFWWFCFGFDFIALHVIIGFSDKYWVKKSDIFVDQMIIINGMAMWEQCN